MKIVAIALNLAVLISSFIVGIEQGLFSPSGEGWWYCLWAFLLIVTSAVSIIMLVRLHGDSWLSLYFKRKALEEKQRIVEIDKKREDKNS
jgi:hypothetical protein